MSRLTSLQRVALHPVAIRFAQLLLWIAIACVAIRAGFEVRAWAWSASAPIRFRGDISNAVGVASQTFLPRSASPRADDPKAVDWPRVVRGYLARYDREYDRVANPDAPQNAYSFDYPPGRLLVVTLWTAPVFVERGVGVGYSDDYAGPMLRVNLYHELVAAFGVFALARRTLVHSGRGRFLAETGAMAAALLAWFSPAAIMNGHGWPQWDVWVLPYTIWAAYFALANRWLMTGLLLAAGAMMKGQVLLIAPIFALWPLFRLDFSALLRLAAGFGVTVAVLMSPWLLRASPAQVWAIGAILLAIAPISLPRKWRFGPTWCVAVAAVGGWTLGPWLHPTPAPASWWHLALLLLALFPFEWVRGVPLRAWLGGRLAIVAWLCSAAPAWLLGSLALRLPEWFTVPAGGVIGSNGTLLAIALLLAIVLPLSAVWRGRRMMWLALFGCATITTAAVVFDGSIAWWKVGFQTDRYHTMVMGGASNLPAILQAHFQMNVDTPVTLFGLLDDKDAWTLRSLLRGIAYGGVALSALALALNERRRDANLLIAIPAAWAILFAVMPQMHERYLLWAAVTSAVLVTRGIGGVLIYITFNLLQLAMMYASMGQMNRRWLGRSRNEWWQTSIGMNPSTGYVALTLAVVLIVWAFRRSAPPRARVAEPVAQPGDKARGEAGDEAVGTA